MRTRVSIFYMSFLEQCTRSAANMYCYLQLECKGKCMRQHQQQQPQHPPPATHEFVYDLTNGIVYSYEHSIKYTILPMLRDVRSTQLKLHNMLYTQ